MSDSGIEVAADARFIAWESFLSVVDKIKKIKKVGFLSNDESKFLEVWLEWVDKLMKYKKLILWTFGDLLIWHLHCIGNNLIFNTGRPAGRGHFYDQDK